MNKVPKTFGDILEPIEIALRNQSKTLAMAKRSINRQKNILERMAKKTRFNKGTNK